MIKIAPSTNPENEDVLVSYVKECEKAGADFMHCDVMDGNFVPAKCLGLEKCLEVAGNSTIALDVHLMVSDPLVQIERYKTCRPTIITIHYESFENKNNLYYALSQIHKNKIMAGISIKPNTDWRVLKPFLPYCDLVLIMSVEPGKSGQKFIEETHEKINDLKNYIIQNNLNIKLEVDGGVNADNFLRLYKNGMDIAVMGNAVYKAQNRKAFIKKVKDVVKQNA